MADQVEELLARLRFAVDQQTLNQAKQAIDQYDAAMKKGGQSTVIANQNLAKMRENAEKLQQVGTTLTIAGAAMTAPLLLAARSYTQAVGETEATSQRWASANERLKDAQIRVGREVVETLTPLMEEGAELAEKFANLLEENPGLVKAILAVGGGLAAGGTIISMIAQVQRLIATVELLSGAKAISSTGSIAVLTANVGKLALTFGPIAIALGSLIALLQSEMGKAGVTAGAQGITTNAYLAGNFFGGPELAAKWGKAVGELTGVIEKAGDETADAVDKIESSLGGFDSSTLEAYLKYVQEEQAAESKYINTRRELIADARQEELDSEKEFRSSQARAITDFRRDTAREDQAYYAERLQMMRDSGKEAARAEEDHQRDVRRMEADSDERIGELSGNLDALGLVRELRSRERMRSEAEEDYQVETRRRDEDLAQSLADMETQFAAQREQRLADFAQQMADADAQHKAERQQRQMALNQQLAEMQKNYQDERTQRRNAMLAQLRDTADALTQERLLKQQFNAAMLADLRNLYDQAMRGTTGSTTTAPSRDIGGYTDDGLYRMHNREFVLNPKTTSAAERLAGRSLDQDAILSLMAGGGGRGSITIANRYDSRISSEERRALNQDAENLLGRILHELV